MWQAAKSQLLLLNSFKDPHHIDSNSKAMIAARAICDSSCSSNQHSSQSNVLFPHNKHLEHQNSVILEIVWVCPRGQARISIHFWGVHIHILATTFLLGSAEHHPWHCCQSSGFPRWSPVDGPKSNIVEDHRIHVWHMYLHLVYLRSLKLI